MNTSANNPNVLAKTLAAGLVLSVVGFLSMASRVTSSSAAFQERILENGVREHVPIKFKIKKEKEESFKDLKNEKWVREFELEVTNTGDKPIYFLYLHVITDVKFGATPLMFILHYGRPELGDLVTKALPDDVPIKPKETYTLKFHQGQIPAWEKSVREGNHPDATKIRIVLFGLSFGDGTGYFGNTQYPPVSKGQADFGIQKDKAKRSKYKTLGRSNSPPSVQTKRFFCSQEPARVSPVNFLPAESLNSLSYASLQSSCLFSHCVKVIVGQPEFVCYNCPVQLRPSVNSSGECKELMEGSIPCTAGSEEYLCQTFAVFDCGFGPGPTPTPTPTPSPQPCNYCTDPNSLGPADCSNPSQPKCDLLGLQYQQNGCCYAKTCDDLNVPPPLPCPPGEARSSDLLQPFPRCNYLPCLPRPPVACVECSSNGDCCNGDVCHSGVCGPPEFVCNPECQTGTICVEALCSFATPILIDVAGDGFKMTNSTGGVNFDFDGDGDRQRLPWTAGGSDDAWLVFDLNRNGLIDNGREMFGNLTNQPRVPPADRNGFLALAEYDKFGRGGNGDGVISSNDFIFRFLRLWTDANHNGISEPTELRGLDQSGIGVLELDYRLSSRTDQHGNQFRYRAKVKSSNGAQLGRWAWDVIFNGRGT